MYINSIALKRFRSLVDVGIVGQGPRSAAQRTVDKITGVSCDMVGVLVSPANFFALDSTAQRELILAAVGSTIQVSEVAALLGDLVDMVRPETLTKLAGIDSWEKVLRTQRQMLKRQLKEYVYIPDQDVKPVLVNGKEFTGDIQDLLSKATTQLITIRRERDAIVARSEEHTSELQ